MNYWLFYCIQAAKAEAANNENGDKISNGVAAKETNNTDGRAEKDVKDKKNPNTAYGQQFWIC